MAKKVRQKKNRHITGLLFWVCLVLLAAPFVVLGWILFSSQMDTGTPVLGSRYEGDLDPAITKTQLQEVQTAVSNIEGVENSYLNMATATLRVYVDVADDADSDAVYEMADTVYDTMTGILDPEVYFTQADGKKMYDTEIHVYTLLKENDDDNFVYVIKTKTSAMGKPKSNLVSEPRNAKLAQQLRDDVEKRLEEEAAAAEAEAAGEEPVEEAEEDAEGGNE